LQGAASGGAAEAAARGVGREGVRGRSRGPGYVTRTGWSSLAPSGKEQGQGDGEKKEN